jgi:mannose-6-phosphate isomerase
VKTGDLIEKPWGWERILDLNDRYCVKQLFVEEGKRLSLQYHQVKRETLVLMSGAADLVLNGPGGTDTAILMEVGEAHIIEPGMVHRIVGIAKEGALILEASTPEVDDIVRIQDDFGR